MGLTKHTTSALLLGSDFSSLKTKESDITVCLSGNPNVGKSSVFNCLTGLNQHTGNWSGKTVDTAVGSFNHRGRKIILIDTPGTYSLYPHSKEEEVARDFILNGGAKVTVTVCDATALERNLNLIIQIKEKIQNNILCLNFADELTSKGIHIDIEKLEKLLKIPVIKISAKKNIGTEELKDTIIKLADLHFERTFENPLTPEEINNKAHYIFEECVTTSKDTREKDRKIDRILTGKLTAFPFMMLLLALVFWLTIKGANYPSELISSFFFGIEDNLYNFLVNIKIPLKIAELLIFGIYRVVVWIVSVMLPPMAIFFPLFTLLEDSGYLPRIAFCLDRGFKKCNSCGKQSLTMCMGFGCNAAGVVGCRIIDSKRERLIAILTNSFVPCNGKFPLLISVITMFFVGLRGSLYSALVLTLFILLGIALTFLISYILSRTVLKGVPSSFALELPPYRKPQILKTLIRSVFDRTLFVLGRAVISAVPAGAIIWLLANITVGGAPLLRVIANFLNPFAALMGLDGVIILAFLLSFPANEIVIPVIIMAYMGNSTLSSISDLIILKELFLNNGWNILTALNIMLFSLFHFPCMTTLLTIKKETGSFKWTLLGFLLPTIIGIALCMITTFIYKVLI